MDVEQRIGPAGSARPAVAPLVEVTAATVRDAARVRRLFRRWIDDLADPDTADDLTLAVYETLANVVDHAYAADTDQPDTGPGAAEVAARPMRLEAAVSAPLPTGRALVVTVSDEGVWRDPEDPGFRGRGLPLVRSVTAATVFVTAGGTTVQMRRRVAPGGLAALGEPRTPAGDTARIAVGV